MAVSFPSFLYFDSFLHSLNHLYRWIGGGEAIPTVPRAQATVIGANNTSPRGYSTRRQSSPVEPTGKYGLYSGRCRVKVGVGSDDWLRQEGASTCRSRYGPRTMDDAAKESHGASFNLKGYLAGNPVTDINFDGNSKVPFYHGMALISDELYEATESSCSEKYVSPSNVRCAEYLDVVNEITKDVNRLHILEPNCEFHSPRPGKFHSRIIREKFNDEDQVPLGRSGLPKECRTSLLLLSEFWANNDTVRDALGIRKGTITDWHRCSQKSIPYTYDINSAVPYHLAVTSKGYPALIYSGDHDLVAPHIGTQAWVRSLNFSIVDVWRPWYSGGQVAGFTRRYSNNLTFATVKGAGHTAAEYKPKECLAMLTRWLTGTPL